MLELNESGEVYLAGDFPNALNDLILSPDAAFTDGSFFYSKFDINGQMVYSTRFGGTASAFEPTMHLSPDGSVIFFMTTFNDIFGNPVYEPITPDAQFPTISGSFADFVYTKFDATGQVDYSTFLGGSEGESYDFTGAVLGSDGSLHIVGTTNSTDYPVTSNAAQPTAPLGLGPNGVYSRFGPSGNLVYSTYLGGDDNEDNFSISLGESGNVYIGFRTRSLNLSTTANALQPNFAGGNYDYANVIINPLGEVTYSSYLGGSGNIPNGSTRIQADQQGCFFSYVVTESTDFPVSANAAQPMFGGERDFTVSKFCCFPVFCDDNTISPSIQSFCVGGPIQPIQGNVIQSACGDKVPIYVWQVSTVSDMGPWADIPGAVLPNYSPGTATSTRWYRRLVINPQSMDTVSISNVAAVSGSTDDAPTIDAGPNLYTCPGTSVTIGGSPAVSGGQAPYTISWDFGSSLNDSTLQNPVATVTESTIFTLEVVDANGCYNLDQMVLNVNPADAGPDRWICGPGEQVRIGTLPIPDEPATYSWAPSTGLSCDDCARPFASSATNTNYILTKTIALPGGGTCQTMDTVEVTVLSPPTSSLDDAVWCYDVPNRFEIGYPAEAGKSYTWAPGQWLERNDTSAVFFNSGDIFLDDLTPLTSNPFTYFLTVEERGCTWVDSMEVYMTRADADIDGCGPRTIGVDWHPQIPATYRWTHISGPNLLTGPTDQVVTTVDGHPTDTSVYELEVCFMGVCCTDQVVVPPCGCVVEIVADSEFECAASRGLSLIASGSFSGFAAPYNDSLIEYSWSPCTGLDTCAGSTVVVDDGISETYIVTISHPDFPGVACYDTIDVSDPAVSIPVFSAVDTTICIPGDTVMIGEPPVAEYSYSWSGSGGFSDIGSSPSVDPLTTSEYFVTVTDVGTGCQVKDTSTVVVLSDFADAGPDQVACPGAIVQIGTPDTSMADNFQYSWNPAMSPWQNGTNENSAEPEVLVATSLTFTLMVTDPVSGCSSADTVNITVDDEPPFPPGFSDVTLCGEDSVQLGGDPILNALYDWSPATGLSCTDCPNPIANPDVTTNYTIAITLPGTCAIQPDTTITVTVIEQQPLVLDTVEVCRGQSVEINPARIGECAGCTYSWSPPFGLDDASVINPTRTSVFFDQTYTLTVTDPDGCQRMGEVATVLSQDTMLQIDTVRACPGSTVPLNPSLVGECTGCTYVWSPNADLSDNRVINPLVTVNSSRQYTLFVRHPDGCRSRGVVELVLFEAPDPGENRQICLGESTVLGSPDNDPTSTYSWEITSGPTAMSTIGLDDPNITQPTFTPTMSGTYRLTLTETRDIGGTSCDLSSTVTVLVEEVEDPQIQTLFELCLGTCTEIGPEPQSGLTYIWEPADDLSCVNCSQPTVCPTENRSYTLTIIDNIAGCTFTEVVSVSVADVALPEISIPDYSVCINGNLVIEASITPAGDYDFLWMPATGLDNTMIQRPTLSAAELSPGENEYVLEVTDNATGCVGIADTSLVELTPLPMAALEAFSGTCTDQVPNDDAIIELTMISNGNELGYVQGADYTGGPAYGTPGNIMVSGSSAQITGLMHDTEYTIRVFQGSDECFTDYTLRTLANTCCPSQNCFDVEVRTRERN